MNCLNISLVDDGGGRVRAGAEADPKSRPAEPEVAELGLLGASSPCTVALLGAKSPSDSLAVTEIRKKFF